MSYQGETDYFKLSYMQDGDTMSGAINDVVWAHLDAIMQGLVDALGVGVIEGGHGSIVAGDLSLTALKAIIADGQGGVYVERAADTIDDTQFSNGDNYVHCQLTAQSREDKSCTYYVDASPTPASDAIAICKVTKTGGALTAVDNTIKAAPAIQDRLFWELFKRSQDDSTTLLAFLTAILGGDYLGASPPAAVDARLDALEAGGGGGGGGTIYWNGLEKAVGDPTSIVQQIVADIAAHVAALHAGGGGGGGEAVDVPWDVDAVNQARHLMKTTRTVDPETPITQVDTVCVVWDAWGDGTGAGPDFIDRVNSTWLPVT